MHRILPFALLACLPLVAAEPLPLVNPGFEQGLTGWKLEDAGMSSLSQEQAATGKASLKVVDASEKDGSNAVATPVEVNGVGVYRLRGKAWPVSGAGCGIYVRALDKNGQVIGKGDEFQRGAPTEAGGWRNFEIMIDAPEGTAALQLWIHSYGAAQVVCYLDDFAFEQLGVGPPPTPLWTPQYKLKPTDKLTAADVVGPDGVVYPNFARAGVPGGIPNVPVKARLRDFGGLPDDDRDDADAIEQAASAVGQQGGGAILMEPGVYHLDRKIAIRDNHIVLRGSGMDQTRVLFRYAIGPDGATLAEPRDGNLYGNSTVELHAVPTGLNAMEIRVGESVIGKWARSTHSGNTFNMGVSGANVIKAVPGDATEVTLTGVASYADGKRRETTRTFRIRREGSDPMDYRRPPGQVAISFSGEGRWYRTKPLLLTADGLRGQTSLTLESTEGLAAGDWLTIDGPATDRWKTLTRNACLWGTYRRNILQITAVRGNQVDLAEPLRIEFPVIDGSRVWEIDPIVGCGLEDMTIRQTENLWITTAQFSYAQGCWAKGVKVEMCGRNPVYGYEAEQCTIADCVFDDAWYKGGGGTAYSGWEVSYDCLMTDVTTYKLRHAPLFQWAASGCVIRRSKFVDSDAQWHSGWTNENLFEQCDIVSVTGNGGYGFGMWASPPEDTAHGPNGPRNVVYNCDVTSPRDGLWMGGMNEGWIIAYNRFRVEKASGITAKTFSFDHQLIGNVFALADPGRAAVLLLTEDCTGVEARGNTLYSDGSRFSRGPSKLLVDQDNRVLPYQADPPRPQPLAPSLYEWQVARAKASG